ncbi:N-acetylmuramoyl-L-alanine amidase [Antarcticirhabdus aurantiaca]|uniref:N-acetylmuramoyl-L-alanine amidase n=1 Tax=Antarcticirhabdus aurantiaca TaxID=2606717 RepID=A0ACD4NNY3_9HYPH|nr:N-acetylmuramoyl-L-alanine amidase [Antarcticirhabdus aurantiaca]WAJ28457.1 N-acetylmuramoyl-L-alanine amidase [Jeongeuplla avenae]
MATVVIDPGHGGQSALGGSSANNAVGPAGTLEKTLTLDVGRRLRSLLQGRGHTVILTRDGDNNLGLRDRAAVARDSAASVFLSIHFNGSVGHNAQGTETFVHTQHRPASATLCRVVQPKLVGATGLFDRNRSHGGVKTQALGVLQPSGHHPSTACCLVEVSFLDRADEEQRLRQTDYRDRIAVALADGIGAYLGLGASFALADDEELEDGVEVAAVEAGLTVEEMNADLTRNAVGMPGAEGIHPMQGSAAPDRLGEIASKILEPVGTGIDSGEFSVEPIGNGFDRDTFHDVPTARARLAEAFAGAALESFDYESFDDFVRQLRLRHFRSIEFLFLGSGNQAGNCRGKNSLPPKELWGNLRSTALMVDEIRERLQAPIHLLSVYRSKPYNSCIGGESGSLHMRFNAIDWTCPQKPIGECWQVAREVRDTADTFTGGIGFYPDRSFVHIDTRGATADW